MNIPYKYRCKNFQQNISKWNPATYKIIIPHDQMKFISVIQNYFNIEKSVNVICHIIYYNLKKKNHIKYRLSTTLLNLLNFQQVLFPRN